MKKVMVLDAKFWDFEFTLRTLGYRRFGEVKLGSNFGRDLNKKQGRPAVDLGSGLARHL